MTIIGGELCKKAWYKEEHCITCHFVLTATCIWDLIFIYVMNFWHTYTNTHTHTHTCVCACVCVGKTLYSNGHYI